MVAKTMFVEQRNASKCHSSVVVHFSACVEVQMGSMTYKQLQDARPRKLAQNCEFTPHYDIKYKSLVKHERGSGYERGQAISLKE